MYLGIDIGGTKTLVALLDEQGALVKSEKFPTPPNYQEFLQQLQQTVADLGEEALAAACVAMPGRVNEDGSIAEAFGNLTWTNIPLKADCERLFNCTVLVENDAKLAGLGEAKLITNEFKKVLYITISTGIGYSLVVNGVIDTNVADGGGRTMLFERDGKLVPWESFASGKAIVERYGKRASEIDDPAVWQVMAGEFAVGIIDLIGMLQPDVIVFGGGVGTHFAKFEQPLMAILKQYETPMITIPALVRAQHPEEAVIYGCYEFLKARHENATQ